MFNHEPLCYHVIWAADHELDVVWHIRACGQALNVQVTWRSDPNANGSNSWCTAFSLSACTYSPMRVPYCWGLVDRGRKDSRLVFRYFCTECWHHPKMGIYSTTEPFWDIQKGQWWRIQSWRTSSSVPAFSFGLEKKWPNVWFTGYGKCFDWIVRDLEGRYWKIGDKLIWGKVMLIDFSEWGGGKREDICIRSKCAPKGDLSWNFL